MSWTKKSDLSVDTGDTYEYHVQLEFKGSVSYIEQDEH